MSSETQQAKPPVIGTVTTERRGCIFLIGIDRRSKLNSFDPTMLVALGQAYYEYEHDDDLWCAVLFGHGDNFTSGLDLAQVAPSMADGSRDIVPENYIDYTRTRSYGLTKPIIVAVQGYCYTLGIEIMLASDIRIAAQNTRFSQLEVKRGIYATGGATIRMVQEMGWGNAMRYLLTGDEFGVDVALRTGLIQEIVETGKQLDRAIELAEVVAAQAPLAVKATLRSARIAVTEGEEVAKKQLRPDQIELLKTEDAKEGVRAFVERRPGKWQGK